MIFAIIRKYSIFFIILSIFFHKHIVEFCRMKRLTLTIFSIALCWNAVAQTASTIKIEANDSPTEIIKKSTLVVPTANQMSALRNEFIAFIHFGPNTFTGVEWGNGVEEPKVFDLKTLDTDQWCRAMRDAGMKMVILTAKHHDGFVLWQSRYTKHGIMSTGFQDGKGDVMRDLSASCKKHGLKLGVYLSPADLYQIENKEGLYGNGSQYSMRTIPRAVEGRPFSNKKSFTFNVDDYNEYFLNQLFELLTEYGPIEEVWFDGAHPKTKGGQTYNYKAWEELIHTLAPKAVIFGRADVRWCGNESGATRDTEFNVIPYPQNPAEMGAFPDLTSKVLGSRDNLHKAKYLHYQQAETNTSIREGWFYRDDKYQKVRSADDVFDIYERSVGGNSTFLLNIPPNKDGKFPAEDVSVLEEVGRRIEQTYSNNLLKGADIKKRDAEIEISLKKPIKLNRLVLQEEITKSGERIENHTLYAKVNGSWQKIATATNVGYKRILRFADITTDALKITFDQVRATPTIANVSAHYYQSRPPMLVSKRGKDGKITIAPRGQDFGWKPHGENSTANISGNVQIFYTIDGAQPTANSTLYTAPFAATGCTLKAIAIVNGEQGPVLSTEIPFTSKSTTQQIIDLGNTQTVRGLSFTPSKGVNIVSGNVEISNDGSNWKPLSSFEFGNLRNDPSVRYDYFKESAQARYFRISSGTEGIEIF